MDQGNRVAVIVDRGNHVPVIYADAVGSLQKKLRDLRAFAVKVLELFPLPSSLSPIPLLAL